MSIHQFLFKFIQILFNLSPTVVFNKWTIPWCFWPFTHSKIFVFAFNIKNGCFNNHFLVFDIVKAFELMFSWLLKNYIIDCIRRENFCMYQFDVWKWKLNSYRQFMETKSKSKDIAHSWKQNPEKFQRFYTPYPRHMTTLFYRRMWRHKLRKFFIWRPVAHMVQMLLKSCGFPRTVRDEP